MRLSLFILTFFVFFSASAQDKVAETKPVDSLYREDQFYVNLTYNNNIQNAPSGSRQSKFSPGVSFGFLRDMPVNKSRTFAFAVGLGYTFNTYNENLYIAKNENTNGITTTDYSIISSDVYFSKNNLRLQYLDLPIEIRWRSSTPESHMFWRIYTGFKISYLISDKYKFMNDIQTIVYKNNSDLNKIQYGCYMAAGWNTWNAYVYYGLNSVFKNNTLLVGGDPFKMNALNIGLQFYIL